LYLAFEESPAQIMRNMASVGFDLGRWEREGLLKFHATRATIFGLEHHLGAIHTLIQEHMPKVVVMDPISTLSPIGTPAEIVSMLTRVVDFLKRSGITTVFTSLTTGREANTNSSVGISSVMDTWLTLRQVEQGGERRRVVQVLKSRGMPHSARLQEFRLTDTGIELVEPDKGVAR
jgi:circadian clock protein KaiC